MDKRCIFVSTKQLNKEIMKLLTKIWDYVSKKLFGNQKNIFKY